jgi:AraC-like DNA-binding protein
MVTVREVLVPAQPIDEVILAAVTGSVERLLARRGIRTARPSSRNLEAFGAHWNQARRVVGDALALEVAADLPIGGLGLMSYTLVSAETLGDALDSLRSTFLPRVVRGMTLRIAPVSRDYVDVCVRAADPMLQHAEELVIAVIARHLALLERPALPSAVSVRRSTPSELAPWRQFFGVTPRFGQRETSMRLDATHLSTRLRTAAPELHRLMSDLASGAASDSVEGKVRAYVRANLSAALDATAIADALETTPRTLQRWLLEEQTSLRSIVHEVRIAAAREMLEHSRASITEIAETLGFARSTSFTRVFALATGESPMAYRKRVR